MSIRVEAFGPVAVVQTERRLVVGNRQALKTAVVEELENGRRGVVIDFSQTDLIDSGGLGVLVTLYRHAEELGATLLLAGLSEELSDLLRLTKLDTIFEVGGAVDRAVETVRARTAEPSEAPAAQGQPA